MPRVAVNGIELYYETHGAAGDPVVLVHGSWVDHTTWELVVPGLSQALQVVSYDRRGHGASTLGPRPHPVRDDAADLAALLSAIDHYPAHIIAHSYGGAVALRLAEDRPEMVRSLVVHEPAFIGLLAADPATAPEYERMREGIRQMRELIRTGHPEVAARALVEQFSTEPGAWDRLPPTEQARFVRHADRWAEEYGDPEALTPDPAALHDLLIPVLLTEGTLSPPFLHRISARLESRLRNSRLQPIPGAGHAPQITRPNEYVGLIVSFLLERNVPVT